MADNESSPLPSYKTPPVEEVAFGCQFRPLDRLKVPHIGIFWNKLRNEFPLVEHAAPLGSDSGFPATDGATGLPLPRVWLINETESRLIQLQPDRFHFNWRRRESESTYPRFTELFGRFVEYYTEFEKFAAEATIGPIEPVAFELTYINYLIRGEVWQNFEDLEHIVKDFPWKPEKGRFLPTPSSIVHQTAFALPESGGQLTVKLAQGRVRRGPDTTDAFVLELTARGVGSDRSQAGRDAWFNLAHEWIVRGFTDLTTLDVQNKYWGLET